MELVTIINEVSNKTLTINNVLNWLGENFSSFILLNKPIKCSQRTLPCMCFERNMDCLFLDIYKKLNEKKELYYLNLQLEKELKAFYLIQGKKEKEIEWLRTNFSIGINNVLRFSIDNYPNFKMSFINGKHFDEFEYIKIDIEGNDFKCIYDFANIFSKLFFIDKLLPNELSKWKYENDTE